jgi:hypothetical protein
MCDSPSFRLVKLAGKAPASTSCFTQVSVSTTRGSLHDRVPFISAS